MLRVDCDFVIQIGGFHSLFVQVSGAESRTVKFVFLRQEKLRRAGLKAFHNVIRNGVHELDYIRSEEHTSELQSRFDLVCRLLLEKKKTVLRPSSTRL